MVLGTSVMGNVLSPYPFDMSQIKGLKLFSYIKEKQTRELISDPQEDDHPMIIEIRRRVVDAYLELAELNIM